MKVTTTPGLEVALERECLALGWQPRRIQGGVELPDALGVRARKLLRTASRIDGGELLYRRGYRQEIGRAPLRETLAAGLLILTGYDGERPLVDPMCGSGTIAIEAALIAKRPGLVFASDLNAGALGIARRNARRAGVTIQLDRLDVEQVRPPPGPGFIVTNPPYGKRIAGADAALEALARALAKNFAGWRAGILVQGHPAFPLVDLERFRLKNGGLSCELLVGTVRA